MRQTPSRSQVELPVTMRQPLETDGLQTACHVYCCCHKRQESNNTLPQEPHGIAQGPENSCLKWGIGPTPSRIQRRSHLELTPILTTSQMPLLPNNDALICTSKPTAVEEQADFKCPPLSRPDMLHLLQLNKHAI